MVQAKAHFLIFQIVAAFLLSQLLFLTKAQHEVVCFDVFLIPSSSFPQFHMAANHITLYKSFSSGLLAARLPSPACSFPPE